MGKLFSIIGRAIALWWQEVFLLLFFNLIWLILQVPIITGPPATAAMYVIIQKLARKEYVGPGDGWTALRQLFFPALKWGALSLPVVIAVAANFWFYQDNHSLGWIVLRLIWGGIGLGWFTVNLFYWPFWLVQEDRSWRTTMRNSFVFIVKKPFLTLAITFLSAFLIVISYLTTLPMTTILMVWVALIGVLVVEEEMKGIA